MADVFNRVLIANRGEIAVRIAHTLREMGIGVVAVHSDPDRGAPHVLAADEAYPLAGVTSAETYLRGDLIIEIAKCHGIEAIHPGYGFLSENADFAAACAEEGITFIGPRPEAIRSMGDKMVAKALMEKAGVPVVPGWTVEGGIALPELRRQAGAVGYPLLIKAAAGGGGKGMRVVASADELHGAFEAAQREANAAFGDPRVFLERYVARARHVEFQIFGDDHGNAVHLFERECSIQRRHQKIIEEAPSPGLDPALREAMGAAAVRAASAIGYTNAGTVEFLVDEKDRFYFLEVNTRLQVEHPVTEMIVGHDLVRAQIEVALGRELPFGQADLTVHGHALECRIYAEDAARDFMPSTGTVEVYEPPSGPNVRVDSGITAGSEVSVYYDPMLAKLIVRGRDRAESIARMIHALEGFVILGLTTNIEFLRAVLEHESFQAGQLHTRFLEEHVIEPVEAGTIPDEVLIAAALAGGGIGRATDDRGGGGAGEGPSHAGPWESTGGWRAV